MWNAKAKVTPEILVATGIISNHADNCAAYQRSTKSMNFKYIHIEHRTYFGKYKYKSSKYYFMLYHAYCLMNVYYMPKYAHISTVKSY
jgi:hypothetical protein